MDTNTTVSKAWTQGYRDGALTKKFCPPPPAHSPEWSDYIRGWMDAKTQEFTEFLCAIRVLKNGLPPGTEI